ncbi:MAG: hypothetical protein AAFQ43_13390, partial [Bacteroidota bacterium]
MRTFDPSLFLLAFLAALAALIASPADSQEVPQKARAVTPEAAPAVAVGYASEATGLVVGLPRGWNGTQAVDETGLPGRATYQWEHGAGPLAGTTVIVERVTGLNPLLEERWRRGQVAFGYHGLKPTALVPEEAMVFGAGAGLALASGDRVGRAFFVQRGQVFWAVHISAPSAVVTAS